MASAVLSPLQAGSWLMSILVALGLAPSNFTVPETLPTVLLSIGVPAGCAAVLGCSAGPVLSFLLQPAIASRTTSAREHASHVLLRVFIIAVHLSVREVGGRPNRPCYCWDARLPSAVASLPYGARISYPG